MKRWAAVIFLVGSLVSASGFEELPAHDWTVEVGGRYWGAAGYEGYRMGGRWQDDPSTVIYAGPVQWQWGLRFDAVLGSLAAVVGVAVSGAWLWLRGRASEP